jgi:hypothetical protein
MGGPGGSSEGIGEVKERQGDCRGWANANGFQLRGYDRRRRGNVQVMALEGARLCMLGFDRSSRHESEPDA